MAETPGFDELYRELHEMAGRIFRSQRSNHTLQATALVHEAYLKMAGREGAWNDRTHFLATAARAMRQILVNHARDRGAAKRGGGVDRQRVTLSGVPLPEGALDLDVLSLHEALEELGTLDPRQARIAELRTFGGLTNKETAEAVGVSLRTVELEWRMAKDFLSRKLDDGES
jgi:RNA polymerase sigma factor (TIGR02999 family)